MHTEDDTFRHLTRSSFSVVRAGIRRLHRDREDKRKVQLLLERNGWTAAEYQRRLAEVIGNEYQYTMGE